MNSRLRNITLIFSLMGAIMFAQNKPVAPVQGTTPGATQKATVKPATRKPANATSRPNQISITTPKEKRSYSLGLDLGMNFRQQEIDVDLRLLTKGIQDALAGAKPLLNEKDYADVMETFRKEMASRQESRMKILADKNKLEGEKFLAGNTSQTGVVTLPSGLQYKEINAGTGPVPKPTDTVSVHYRGTLIDGSEFDSSYKRGVPVSFTVNGVIPGWTEALQLMKVGAKWQLFVPASLGYGERSPGPEIPPNSTLIFEVELLGIK